MTRELIHPCPNAEKHCLMESCPCGYKAPPLADWELELSSPGVWVAFNYDGSAFVPFATEVEALRYAVDLHMTVKYVPFGDPDWMTR